MDDVTETKSILHGGASYGNYGSATDINTDNNGITSNDVLELPASGSHLSKVKIVTYRRRWYILLLFSALGFIQDVSWNTWGPVTKTAKLVFGWNNSDIALLSLWAQITYLISAVPYSWLLGVKGLRISTVITAFCVFAGCALRCITPMQPAASWLMNAGQIMNGFGGPVSMAGFTLVSSEWFPASQRITATTIGLVSCGVGGALPFILGPLLVREGISTNNASSVLLDASGKENVTMDDLRSDIMRYMYIECGFAGVVFLLILIYFPSRPPTPPSLSAQMDRVDYKAGLKKIVRLKNFWLLAIPYCITTGVYASWMTVLGVNIIGPEVTQMEAGWIGFYTLMTGCPINVIVARLVDRMPRQMKNLLLLSLLLSTLSSDWMTLVIGNYIPFSTAQLYVSCIITGASIVGVYSLFFEMGCEICFPIAEGVTSSLLALLNNVVALVFLLILMIPNIGTMWMNWCLSGSLAVSFITLLFVKESYGRLDVDRVLLTVNVD